MSDNPVQQTILDQVLNGEQGFNNCHDDLYDMANWVAALRKAANYIENEINDELRRTGYRNGMNSTEWVNPAMEDWKGWIDPNTGKPAS